MQQIVLVEIRRGADAILFVWPAPRATFIRLLTDKLPPVWFQDFSPFRSDIEIVARSLGSGRPRMHSYQRCASGTGGRFMTLPRIE